MLNLVPTRKCTITNPDSEMKRYVQEDIISKGV